ncbi:type VI secretion system Vgr family protein, partial [Erwinia sp.]|uniref:type VI secretion system Vgr family protein n=1 Tax=Erwinia citreus TaxID=558 RepID=UPI003C77C85A
MEKWLSQFTGQNPYRLVIHNGVLQPDVLRFRGREALSEPFCWDIEFTCVQDVAPEAVLLKFASFLMRSGKQVHGIVTGLEWLSTSADQSHYRLRLESRLAMLSRTRRSRVFQKLSVPELAEQILREHGFEGPDFDFRLTGDRPEHGLVTQWRESDLAFLRRILSETGIWFRSEMNGTTGMETLIFADSQLAYAGTVTMPYREPTGLDDGSNESVWGLREWHRVVTGNVSVRDYNYRQARKPADARAAVTTGEHYRYAMPYGASGDDAEAEPVCETGAFYARLHHERELNHASHLHLFSNSPDASPGCLLETQGGSAALAECMVIRLTTYIASRDSRLHVSLWGIPYSEEFCIRTALLPRPVISGTLPARVESRNAGDIYTWLDEQGRYRVRLDMAREETEAGYSYLWVRQAKPYSGETYGWHTPLVQGSEVAIAFDGGDPDRPYLAHAFHDSEHPDITTRDNRSRNILRTPACNELHMEDKRGEEHITTATEYGKTQLNQGYITGADNRPRGNGFELRTDEHGVIRVAKGLFISADGQSKAEGEVLDMAVALGEIERCLQQIEQLDIAAQQAQALHADVDSQRKLFSERLKPLNEVIHLSAPEGMALTSGGHQQLAASANVIMNAGESLSVGAMGSINLMAGEKAGLFARTGRLSLIASEGPVVVQAQNAAVRLTSEKKLSISAEEDMLLAGKKRITLIGG